MMLADVAHMASIVNMMGTLGSGVTTGIASASSLRCCMLCFFFSNRLPVPRNLMRSGNKCACCCGAKTYYTFSTYWKHNKSQKAISFAQSGGNVIFFKKAQTHSGLHRCLHHCRVMCFYYKSKKAFFCLVSSMLAFATVSVVLFQNCT